MQLAFAAGLQFALTAQAAPLPIDTKNQGAPTLTLQVKSIDQLLDVIKTTAKNHLPNAMYTCRSCPCFGSEPPNRLSSSRWRRR
jgi:hypothetical protein